MDVYGLGQCCLDYLGMIDEFPAPDTKCEFHDLTIQGGGPVATALVALSRWSLNCSFCGIIGDDPFSHSITESLEQEGVDVSDMIKRSGCSSQFAFIAAEPGRGRRTIFWQRPTGPGPAPGEIRPERIRRAKVFHTDGLYVEAALAAAEVAGRADIPVVVDAGHLREGMLELAEISDFFIASQNFARCLLQGGDDYEKACRILAAKGPELACITLGEKGYVAMWKDRIVRGKSYPVTPVDTTGCGDIFHAGCIYGLLRKWPHEKSLDFAAWAASRTALALGGRAGIPRAEDYPSL